MPRFPVHELQLSDIIPFVLHHSSTLYYDSPDVLVGDNYSISIGDSSILLGVEVGGGMCAPCRWLVSFPLNQTVRECVQVRPDGRSADACGLTDLECRQGEHGRMLTVRLQAVDEDFDALVPIVLQLCDGLINALLHRLWAYRITINEGR